MIDACAVKAKINVTEIVKLLCIVIQLCQNPNIGDHDARTRAQWRLVVLPTPQPPQRVPLLLSELSV